ncbi:unnamed protein product [Rotaria socialis]|uniref:AIG1-type G domain-containing protein n=1 Tax=Rotaria socialis TaxID=392032 RepID=A0A821TCS0_9BILA|nr:unnamed protein product [Rotaria socialis]CAF4873345.1 unnamed protein product [Rotaria socialis]
MVALATGSRNEVRMILLGKTGGGKSSFGNTLIGAKEFTPGTSPNGVTEHCKCASRDFDDKKLFVVDTPGFLDPRIHRDDIQEEIAKAYQVTALPGPHAFLLIVEPTRFLSEDAEAINYLSDIFGPDAIKNTVIIFTHDDAFDPSEGKTIETYLQELTSKSPLRTILDQCQWRYLSVNNRGQESEKRKVIEKLLDMIASIIAKNGGKGYRTTKFDKVAKVNDEEKAKGDYNPIKPDGSIILHPKIKEIIVEDFLRRTVGRKVVH